MRTAPSADDVLRFLSRVRELPCGCWEWTDAKSRGEGNSAWYGSFHYQGGTVRAHRFAHDELGGKTCPPGWHRDHICECRDHDVSLCVHPDHLEAVPHAVQRGAPAGARFTSSRGGSIIVRGSSAMIEYIHTDNVRRAIGYISADNGQGMSGQEVMFPHALRRCSSGWAPSPKACPRRPLP